MSSFSKVFLRHGVYDPLEAKVREVLRRYAIVIQRIYRGFIAKKSAFTPFLPSLR
jgi:myosin heavy subunit